MIRLPFASLAAPDPKNNRVMHALSIMEITGFSSIFRPQHLTFKLVGAALVNSTFLGPKIMYFLAEYIIYAWALAIVSRSQTNTEQSAMVDWAGFIG